MKLLVRLLLTSSCLALVECSDGVISFPTPEPAQLRIVNTTSNVPQLRVTIDSSSYVDVARGAASDFTSVPAGRQVKFFFGSPSRNYRTDLRFTLGGSARVLLFVWGDSSSVIEYRREIQDTVLAPGTPNAFVRFTHMGGSTGVGFYEVDVWVNGQTKLTNEYFDPGKSSAQFTQLTPGTYTFELRETGTTTVLATLPNVDLRAGTAYMLYSYDAATPGNLQLDIF
jgi:hypothetical protein